MNEFERLGEILNKMGYPVDFEEASQALTADIHKNAVDHGWWEKPEDQSIPSKLMLIVSEVAEAMEEFRIDQMATYYEYTENGEWKGVGPTPSLNPNHKSKPCGFGVELADAMIRIRDLCGYLKIDIDKLVDEKHQYNKSREYRHGNKRA